MTLQSTGLVKFNRLWETIGVVQPNFIYNTWPEGHFDGKCSCGYTFSVTKSEASSEDDAQRLLEQKFQAHVQEKHKPEDFSQATARKG